MTRDTVTRALTDEVLEKMLVAANAAGDAAFNSAVLKGQSLPAARDASAKAVYQRFREELADTLDDAGLLRPSPPDDVELKYRRELWLGHGHSLAALYGDDGEMQCGLCRCGDYRRAPLDEVERCAQDARLIRAADAIEAAAAPHEERPTPPAERPFPALSANERAVAKSAAAATLAAVLEQVRQVPLWKWGEDVHEMEDGRCVDGWYCAACGVTVPSPPIDVDAPEHPVNGCIWVQAHAARAAESPSQVQEPAQ